MSSPKISPSQLKKKNLFHSRNVQTRPVSSLPYHHHSNKLNLLWLIANDSSASCVKFLAVSPPRSPSMSALTQATPDAPSWVSSATASVPPCDGRDWLRWRYVPRCCSRWRYSKPRRTGPWREQKIRQVLFPEKNGKRSIL